MTRAEALDVMARAALAEAGLSDGYLPEAREGAEDFAAGLRAGAPGGLERALEDGYREALRDPDVAAAVQSYQRNWGNR